MKSHFQKNLFLLAAGFGILVAGAVLLSYPPVATSQTSSAPITGWAWSDTIGWVDFNCSNRGTCGSVNFGVVVNEDGTLSGHAWSQNIGWISANASDLSGCPQSPCNARFQNGKLLGWMKALSGGGAQSGGWDGFIALGDTNTGDSINYGVTADENGNFSGYAWGSTVVGWLAFSTSYGNVRTDYQQCTPTYFCQDGDSWHRNAICAEQLYEDCHKGAGWSCANGSCVAPPDPRPPANESALRLTPSAIQVGQTVTATWSLEYADSCTITINGVAWLVDVAASGSEVTAPLYETTEFRITCTNTEGSYSEVKTVIVSPVWQEV